MEETAWAGPLALPLPRCVALGHVSRKGRAFLILKQKEMWGCGGGGGVETGGDAQIVGLSRLYGTLHEFGLELGKLGARVDFSDEHCKVKKIIFDHFFLTPQCFSGLAGISVKLLKNAVSGISHREVVRGTHI